MQDKEMDNNLVFQFYTYITKQPIDTDVSEHLASARKEGIGHGFLVTGDLCRQSHEAV